MFNCSCCQNKDINNLDSTFTSKRAQQDAQAYLKKGLEKRAQQMIAPLQGKQLHSILDIGCGAGAVHHELLRQGIGKTAVGIDASSAFIAAAQNNGQHLQLTQQLVYHQADFAQTAEQFDAADIVILDRVICCYPHLDKLFGQAAIHTKHYLVASFPLDNWWLKLPFQLIDSMLSLFRSGYHPYLHAHDRIEAIARQAGLKPMHKSRHWMWQLMVWEK